MMNNGRRPKAAEATHKEMSEKLFISLRTVKAHMTNIFNKLGCSSRTDAIIKGLKQGYIDLNDIQ